jgi:hypothetical protein
MSIKEILETYSGEDFFKAEFLKREFLIDKIMRERDSMLIVGGEKAGKSILTQQLVFSLTSGTQLFLDEYEVLRPCHVVYVQGEGDKADTQKRFRSMRKNLEFDESNFTLVYAKNNLGLEIAENMKDLEGEILNKIVDKEVCVIIFDPLYFCFNGSISDDLMVRKFLGNIRELKEKFNCAIIIVHHTHKLKFDMKGKVVEEGDEAIFGSGALKWFPDHLVLFSYNKNTGIRTFQCNTQRSGDIVRYIDLRLNQPDPLYLTKAEHQIHADQKMIHDKSHLIVQILQANPEGLTVKQIYEGGGFGKATFYRDVKKLLVSGQVTKHEELRPVIYRIFKE